MYYIVVGSKGVLGKGFAGKCYNVDVVVGVFIYKVDCYLFVGF